MLKIFLIILNLGLISCQTKQPEPRPPEAYNAEHLDKAEIFKLEEEQRILWDEMGK